MSLRILQYIKGVRIRVELSINFNVMQPDYGYGVSWVVQLVHNFLLPAYFVALEKSINLEGLVLKLNAVNSLT